ncbi:TolB family protein [Kineococcus sp. SYSU DK003]|uniref:TolB family protein n=1 Tax=Kineococcus sp. SYSU DK003 TaxID=3383124 RepID=UPI003D7EE4BF
MELRRPATMLLTLTLAHPVSALSAPAASAEQADPGGGGAIVFVSDRDSLPLPNDADDEVYLYDPATGTTDRVTDNDVQETFPVLSPDGQWLAFLDRVRVSIDVCRLTRSGTDWSCPDPRGVVSYPAPDRGRFAWTPDGASIVYSATDPVGGDADLFSVDLTKLEPPRNLTQEDPAAGEEGEANEVEPAVSPDGEHGVYERWDRSSSDLFRRRVDGSEPVALTATTMAREAGPAFSPDGERIAFHANRTAPDDVDVYAMGAEPESADNPARDLTASDGSTYERYPSWSPDGTQLTYWWSLTPQGQDDGEVCTVGADGNPGTNLTANNPTDPAARPVGDTMPSWGSPVP